MKPISRAQLQNLYAEEVARKRNETIQTMVTYVYRQISAAATTSSTEKKCIVCLETLIHNKEVLQDLSKDIVSQVGDLFPDCKVQYCKGIYTDNRRKTGEFIPIPGDVVPSDAHYVVIVDWS